MLAPGDYMDITCHACISGNSVDEDIKRLEAGVQIVVTTPGRVFDRIERSALRKSSLSTFDTDVNVLMSHVYRYETY